jgi:hypothetical protein
VTGKGAVLARHEGDFRVGAEDPLSLDDVLAMLGDHAEQEGRSREDAIACYLSGGEGWREAVKLLGGTFAREASGLRERKPD